jgi:hypothetical protein
VSSTPKYIEAADVIEAEGVNAVLAWSKPCIAGLVPVILAMAYLILTDFPALTFGENDTMVLDEESIANCLQEERQVLDTTTVSNPVM